MGVKRTSKATKTFMKKGLLKKKIDSEKKHRKSREQAAVRKMYRGRRPQAQSTREAQEEDEKNMFDAPSESELSDENADQDENSESGSDHESLQDDDLNVPTSSKKDKTTKVSYDDAFTFVRKLALLVRQALKGKSSDASKSICNWEFVQAIQYWSKALADQDVPGKKSLTPLIYPFVQTALGACKVAVVPRYFPFRFHILHALLSFKSHTYIPVAPLLFEALESPSVTKTTKNNANLKAFDLSSHIHCPDGYKGSRAYAQFLVDESLYLLTQYVSQEAQSPAFPEYSVALIVGLKKAAKLVHPGVAPKIKALVDKLEQNATWVDKRRKPSDFGHYTKIKDTAPFMSYADVQRKIRDQIVQTQANEPKDEINSDIGDDDDDDDDEISEEEDFSEDGFSEVDDE